MKGNRRRKDRLSRFPCPDGRLIQKIPVHVVNSTFLRQFRYLFRLCIQDSTERKVCQGNSILLSGLGAGGTVRRLSADRYPLTADVPDCIPGCRQGARNAGSFLWKELRDSGEDRPLRSKGAARAAIHHKPQRRQALSNLTLRPKGWSSLRAFFHNPAVQPAAPAAAPSPFREYSQIPQMNP